MSANSDYMPQTLSVEVKNWPDPGLAKNPVVKNTSVRTVLLSATGDGTSAQIADYEPSRLRMVIIPLDAPIVLVDSVPTVSPDPATGTVKPANGGVLPNGIQPYELFGPDAWWINRLAADTRVTIIKEFGR